ncbi:hypothetical protein, partial [Nonomuraea antimicrobica]|uniref:hypothetical protein n=1 Tax=Nonomuraea antimicrobica TaxID=561173 RepID=UPI0031ED6A5A
AFVGFVDTARDPGHDLAAESRRTGIRRYALGHLVADGDGCAPKWAGLKGRDAAELGGDAAEPDNDTAEPDGDAADVRSARPLAERIERLRAAGGDVVPVLGGSGGKELAATCTRSGALTDAYRRVADAFDAPAVDFEVRDGGERATVLRRARAIGALQNERDLRVSVTLPLRRDGLAPGDVTMLRLTREAGAEIATVNLLAPIEPRGTEGGRLGQVAIAVQAAVEQLARAHDLKDPGQAWRHVALTPVLAGERDLSELDARKLTAYADRHGLAWLSLRGVMPKPDVSYILWRTPA